MAARKDAGDSEGDAGGSRARRNPSVDDIDIGGKSIGDRLLRERLRNMMIKNEELTSFASQKGPNVDDVEAENRKGLRDGRLKERLRSSFGTKEESGGRAAKVDGKSRREQRAAKRDQMDVEVFNAVKNGDPQKLRELMDDGANMNTVYRDYSNISTKSLLHVCCEKGQLLCAKILVENGAFLNIRDKWGQTPLMYCMITQYHEIGEMLLDRQPNLVDDKDHFGKSALHCAAESGSLESVRLLLKYGADVCGHDCYGVTPVMSAVSQKEGCSDYSGVIQMMVDAGYKLELKDFRSKRTALQMAVLAGNIAAVEILLTAGADVNTIDGGLRTPLTNAIYRFARKTTAGGPCVVEPDGMVIIVMLTQYQSNLNMSQDQCNPLVGCASVDNAELAQYFLDNGANPNIRFEPSGATPLIIATGKNSVSVVRVLLEWPCQTNQMSIVHRCDVDYTMDALQLALLLGHMEIARLLVLSGCSLQSVRYLKRFIVGEEIPFSLQRNPEFFEWLQDLASNPVPLLEACVRCVRKVLVGSLQSKVECLPVPNQIKDMITVANSLDCSDTFSFVK
ncbi:ankyrin repeat, PH and SEC7 domain containing protein secG-like [Liolophura sinensis]|uniref:ankyrin repeat, PH and SEC7 domain containing protein secG-like n=1 Tax=Liolophura sinensis TaxID=3198878 RepID=UPI003158A6DA